MKSCYFGRKRWYDADEVDKILAELRENNKILAELSENNKKALKRDADNWNRLCVKYNKLIELKKEFCEKFKDIELEIDK